MQIEMVEAKFRNGAHPYSFSPNGLELKVGQYVLVETDKGRDIVRITKSVSLVNEEDLIEPLKNVVRVATEKELKDAEENYKKAEALLPEVKKIVSQEGLEMKVISVECNYNFSRLTVNFTSENRVDFRDLVKKLADKYKMRIELRQIGPREATRILGGLGMCGKECCCRQGFGIEDHVSIKMAKTQGLSLNPNSISGVCGKLLCCLAFENPFYEEILKVMPRVGAVVSTPNGDGVVVYNDLFSKRVSVRFDDGNSSEIQEFELEQLGEKKSKIKKEKK
jgi:cell fate regulator YaaT (PSP1 superfamily)